MNKKPKCVCGSGLTPSTENLRIEVDGHIFLMPEVPALRCEKCGESSYDGRYLETFEVLVAGRLAAAGVASGEAFRFMRKAIGLPAKDLADLLEVQRETVSRWENEKQPVERRALALLGNLVDDRIEGSQRTLERLRALKEPPRLAKTTKVQLSEQALRIAER